MSRLLQTVIRVDPSPMNPKVKVVELSCGHDVYVRPPKRAPRVGAVHSLCDRCSGGS